jgi:hypothetical protein
MPLQSNDLVLVGLGIVKDKPPNSIQSKLADGMHLRFSPARGRGFPWYGYYLFRRPHQQGNPLWLSSEFKPEWKAGPWPSSRVAISSGQFASNVNLAFVDQFSPAGPCEFDLRGRKFLRFDLFPPNVVREFHVRLGLGSTPPPPQKSCVDFTGLKPGSLPSPYISNQVQFTGPVLRGDASPNFELQNFGKATGLLCQSQLTVSLPNAATAVELDLSCEAQPVTIFALDANRQVIGQKTMSVGAGAVETIQFSNQGISSLTISAPGGRTLLHRICYLLTAAAEPNPVGPIKLTAFHGSVRVAHANVSGRDGDVITATLKADIMTAIEIEGGPAALGDLGFVPVAQDLAVGWGSIPGIESPLCLPTRHSDYPCPVKPTTDAQAEAAAIRRIHYGDPAKWGGQIFADLTDVLNELVVNGPPPGGKSMPDRWQFHAEASSSPDPPSMPRQYPLDLLLLGSLHPPIAMMLGLYAVDPTAQPGVAYDYTVIADHNGLFHGNPTIALTALSAPLPDDVDVWVTYGKTLEAAPPLPAPSDVRVFALPDGFVANSDPDAPPPAGFNAAGLVWRIDAAADGKLLPDTPIGYHLWRAFLESTEPTTAPPQSHYVHATENGMIVVANAAAPADSTPENAGDWPPVRLFAYDRDLADGWYSYQVSAVDLYGRHSATSPPSAWLQWEWPAGPTPKPWYYIDPPAERQINAFAVGLFDKSPPPPPTGLEADALDPDDAMLLHDDAYVAWWNAAQPNWWTKLTETNRANLLGLRVRWKWTRSQMLQAPDTQEFRIYFNPGTKPPSKDPDELPPNYSDPLNWENRVYVVACDENFSVTDKQGHPLIDEDGHPVRQYEVLLPIIGDPRFAGVPLAATDADPIVYAHVGVSAADDKEHTADNSKWTSGHWGARSGNEGGCALAKIYRVLRTPPPPPGAVDDSDKVFATRADYNSRSFVTIRWPRAAYMQGHIFRALDNTLAQVGFGLQPRPPLDSSDAKLFPVASWAASTRADVATALDALNSLPTVIDTDSDEVKNGKIDAAMELYRALPDNALRVLAGLPGNEVAFSRVTYTPLDPDDLANADRAGPDGQAGYAPNPALCAYTAELDGRAENRYFFRAAYVNRAHTIGKLGPSSPPVYLPKIAPPRTPVITKISSGELAVTLTFAANREADFAEYRIYRADEERNARDIRSMDRVGTVPLNNVDTVPLSNVDTTKPAVEWTDSADLIAGRKYFYRLSAVDTSGNESAASAPSVGIAVDTRVPEAPVWVGQTWFLRRESDGGLFDWPADGVLPAGHKPALMLEWQTDTPEPYFVISRRAFRDRLWIEQTKGSGASFIEAHLAKFIWVDPDVDPTRVDEYRIRARSSAGVWSTDYRELRTARPQRPS